MSDAKKWLRFVRLQSSTALVPYADLINDFCVHLVVRGVVAIDDALNNVTASPKPAIDRHDDSARQSVIALRVRQPLPDIPLRKGFPTSREER
jgi:hypothetical protein